MTGNGTNTDDRLLLPEGHSLYRGTVTHHRTRPVKHHLSYQVFSLLLDIDDLPSLNTVLPGVLSHNGKSIVQVLDKDHGPRNGDPLRPWINRILSERGYSELVDQPAKFLCFPRLWGYAFNPLTIYYCYHADGTLAAVLYHVSNTFGESHCYLLPVEKTHPSGKPISHATDKVFHVSPFMQMDCRYRFNFKQPGKKLAFQIAETDQEGKPLLYANHIGTRHPLTGTSMVRALVTNPALSQKIIAGIHWEALKLWVKGAPFFPKPIKSETDVT